MWDGFNREEHGEFTDWDIPQKNGGLSPHELYQNVLGASISPSPHSTYRYNVIIADENENYVCFSGMWWVQENQHKGLAAAALSRHDAVLRPLGAEIMTGGGNDFYKKIGYKDEHVVLHFQKKS